MVNIVVANVGNGRMTTTLVAVVFCHIATENGSKVCVEMDDIFGCECTMFIARPSPVSFVRTSLTYVLVDWP